MLQSPPVFAVGRNGKMTCSVRFLMLLRSEKPGNGDCCSIARGKVGVCPSGWGMIDELR